MTAQRRVSVPGKVMLAGEYSVLFGGQALATTVDHWMHVDVVAGPQADPQLYSDLWEGALALSHVNPNKHPLAWPMADSLQQAMHRLQVSVAACRVHSQLNPRYGLGSSSALRLAIWHGVAALGASPAGAAVDLDGMALTRAAFEDQRRLQGRASGYDMATQWQGGLVLFTAPRQPHEPWPAALEKRCSPDLSAQVHIWVGGKGAATGPVVRDTMPWLERGQVREAILAANQGLIQTCLHEPSQVVQAAAAWHQVFRSSPHFPHHLADKLDGCPGFGDSWSFKTTGAGGEDAILLLGTADACEAASRVLDAAGWQPLPGSWTEAGLHVSEQVYES